MELMRQLCKVYAQLGVKEAVIEVEPDVIQKIRDDIDSIEYVASASAPIEPHPNFQIIFSTFGTTIYVKEKPN